MKTLFTFYVDSAVDLITNSSSELFVFTGDTKKNVSSMIRRFHNNYLSEYESLKRTDELTLDELDWYVQLRTSRWSNELQEQVYTLLPGFTDEEQFRTEPHYWREDVTVKYPKGVTEENRERYIKALDPDGKLFFLWSKDENPNWDIQEKLMTIGVRYHLG